MLIFPSDNKEEIIDYYPNCKIQKNNLSLGLVSVGLDYFLFNR